MPTDATRAFRHCPRCAVALADITNPLRCVSCDLTWFFNPSCAAGAFLFDPDGRCLFVRRAKEPRKGTLALPGGFIDFGESAEEALRREIHEEVGLTVTAFRFVGSCPNRYEYRGVVYDVCDFLFAADVADPSEAVPLDGVAGIEWHRLVDVSDDDIAFPSICHGRRVLLGTP
jgi:ADP-ribose pyrophosphatase YjhB (NUDIX family)/ribosomal protein S27AE